MDVCFFFFFFSLNSLFSRHVFFFFFSTGGHGLLISRRMGSDRNRAEWRELINLMCWRTTEKTLTEREMYDHGTLTHIEQETTHVSCCNVSCVPVECWSTPSETPKPKSRMLEISSNQKLEVRFAVFEAQSRKNHKSGERKFHGLIFLHLASHFFYIYFFCITFVHF